MKNVERERKFLVRKLDYVLRPLEEGRPVPGTLITQGYLLTEEDRSLRVRVAQENAILTLKGPREGNTRIEYEANLPYDIGIQLLSLCEPVVVSKMRYPIVDQYRFWVVDVFLDKNEGLAIAEIELGSEQESFVTPEWCGQEVTNDERYYNQYLAQYPYAEWDK